MPPVAYQSILFLSTLSLRRATRQLARSSSRLIYFYPRSPCGERLSALIAAKPTRQISIHALLAESDVSLSFLCKKINISIHALLAESDPTLWTPTPPLKHFYPRSPCGERQTESDTTKKNQDISIHALLAESDQAANGLANAPPQISIHALLAESDLSPEPKHEGNRDFYPRSPCGERRLVGMGRMNNHIISIHALLAESDIGTLRTVSVRNTFLSTLSLRRATC